MAEERPGLDFIAKYLPEAVGYFQGRRAIKDEVARLREQDPVRQDRIQMDPGLQQAFREGNTRGDVDQQLSIDRSVQEAIRRNPRNIAKAIEAGQTASSKTRAADNLRRIRNLQTAGTLGQRLNQLNATIDLGNEVRERQQEDRIANAEFQKRRLNMRGLSTLSSALGEGLDAFGNADKEVKLGPEGRAERGVARGIDSAGGRTSDLIDFLGQGTASPERPEANLDGITIDPNAEVAQNRAGEGGINVVTAPEDRVMSGGSLPEVTVSPAPEAIDLRPESRSVVEQILMSQMPQRMEPISSIGPMTTEEAEARQRSQELIEGQRRYGIEPLQPRYPFDEKTAQLINLGADDAESLAREEADMAAAGRSALYDMFNEYVRPDLLTVPEEPGVTLSEEEFPRYRGGEGDDRIRPSIYFDPQLNRFSPDYDPNLRAAFDGRFGEYFQDALPGSMGDEIARRIAAGYSSAPQNRKGGAVVTPDGYDHDGVDINMTDAENGKFLGSVESAEMIVNAKDTNEGLRLAKKNPNNPLSKWYLNLTRRFQKEAKEREAQNKR
jgi:hypothetical protein